jgi:hypothetical protein
MFVRFYSIFEMSMESMIEKLKKVLKKIHFKENVLHLIKYIREKLRSSISI